MYTRCCDVGDVSGDRRSSAEDLRRTGLGIWEVRCCCCCWCSFLEDELIESDGDSGGGGDGAGDACLEPDGLNPRPRNGLTRPVGEPALELMGLLGSAIMANA